MPTTRTLRSGTGRDARTQGRAVACAGGARARKHPPGANRSRATRAGCTRRRARPRVHAIVIGARCAGASTARRRWRASDTASSWSTGRGFRVRSLTGTSSIDPAGAAQPLQAPHPRIGDGSPAITSLASRFRRLPACWARRPSTVPVGLGLRPAVPSTGARERSRRGWNRSHRGLARSARFDDGRLAFRARRSSFTSLATDHLRVPINDELHAVVAAGRRPSWTRRRVLVTTSRPPFDGTKHRPRPSDPRRARGRRFRGRSSCDSAMLRIGEAPHLFRTAPTPSVLGRDSGRRLPGGGAPARYGVASASAFWATSALVCTLACPRRRSPGAPRDAARRARSLH